MKYLAEDFVNDISKKPSKTFAFGNIASDYASGKPRISFDGETTISDKLYNYLEPYIPKSNDRVLLAKVNGVYIILGKVA